MASKILFTACLAFTLFIVSSSISLDWLEDDDGEDEIVGDRDMNLVDFLMAVKRGGAMNELLYNDEGDDDDADLTPAFLLADKRAGGKKLKGHNRYYSTYPIVTISYSIDLFFNDHQNPRFSREKCKMKSY